MPKTILSDLRAEEILDSRGIPTVEVTAVLQDGIHVREAVPSGASTGKYEALELRDQNPERYEGKGVLQACANVQEKIFPKLRGIDVTRQEEIDHIMLELDGSANKTNLGANAILAVSLACARLASTILNVPLYRYLRDTFSLRSKEYTLPEPMLNIINGGKHADNGLDFQEFMVIPHAATFAERMRIGAEVYFHLGALIKSKGQSTLIGDEGGFAPRFHENSEPLAYIAEAVGRTQYRLGRDLSFGLDVAASELYLLEQRRYFLSLEKKLLGSDDLINRYEALASSYPIASIEDGLAEEDWAGWGKLTKRLKGKMLLVGDDLFVTNKARLERGIHDGAGNAILIKPNQIGTLTETMETIALAQEHGYTVIVSHRSGETGDDFIADLTVAVHAPYIKAGAVARGERLAKYNRLMEIEHELAA